MSAGTPSPTDHTIDGAAIPTLDDIASQHFTLTPWGTVTDDDLHAAMRVLFEEIKRVVEPACAAATAGLPGPLRDVLRRKRVGVLLCGTNTGPATFSDHLAHAS
jgi:threonine dehydratase